ncbi:MAG TPA: ankyrin repeat domain-containing protein [Armatimonadota bacterium]|nr:ankyrin repeat domain-containing protein [Armatimonadota bacterium]
MNCADDMNAAVIDGDLDAVRRLAEEHPGLIDAAAGPQAWTPIVTAIYYGYCARGDRLRPVVDFLLESGCEVDLSTAALLDDVERARAIVGEDPQSVHAADADGVTALHSACERGSAEIAELLIAAGADVNARTAWGAAPLEGAAHPGPLKLEAAWDVVQLLRSHGAEYDVILAASAGDAESVRAFLDEDATRISARRNDGTTALFAAAKNLHAEVVSLLIERGADVNARREDGQTPLSTAQVHDWDTNGPETVDLLLAAGATPTAEE